MCTIVLLHRVHPRWPVVIAANRDEYYSRAASAPEVLTRDPVPVLGGRDARHAGTWMGATQRGFFVGLTNQRTLRPADASRRSRGEVVLEALRQGSREAVDEYLRGLDAPRYNPFNLMYGDAHGMSVAYVRDERPFVSIDTLGAGVHVLANDRIGSEHFPKADRALALVHEGALAQRPWETLRQGLVAVLRDHALPPPARIPEPPPGSVLPGGVLQRLQALCVHTPVYGTVSSTLVALAPGRTDRYVYVPGAPCRTAPVDVTSLLAL